MTAMNRFSSLVECTTPIRNALNMMGSSERNKFLAGITVVIDKDRTVVGVVTDGDIRRGLARGVTIDQPVETIANPRPMVLRHDLSRRQMRQELMAEARRRNVHYSMFTRLVLVDADGRFFDVIALSDLLDPQPEDKTIAVHGLGYVGLTLACTFANVGLSVIGIDRDPGRIAMLEQGIPPFYEKGLDSLLSALADTNPVRYTTDPLAYEADIHVVSVGSPIGPDKAPVLDSVVEVAETLAKILKRGDLVIFRSTLPVGTMRAIVKPALEAGGLTAGRDFHLSFAPERTIEGRALEELRTLPQVVGGYDKESADVTAKLFSRITSNIVEVESLEAAELIKLANNTFRDLVFAFSNELAAICDSYNINAFRLIQAANDGYPRNPIPTPSPGVGGLCLSKDPYLYSHPIDFNGTKPILGSASRQINGAGERYILSKIEAFASAHGKTIADLEVLLIGLAFKGMPETSDMRDSVALALVEAMPNRQRIHIKDFVIPANDITAIGCQPVDALAESFGAVDVVLVLNNHYMNNRFNVIEALRRNRRPVLFFDGWNMFDQREIEALPHVSYATMGYVTQRQ